MLWDNFGHGSDIEQLLFFKIHRFKILPNIASVFLKFQTVSAKFLQLRMF